MANYNIEMQYYNGSSYDVLYPRIGERYFSIELCYSLEVRTKSTYFPLYDYKNPIFLVTELVINSIESSKTSINVYITGKGLNITQLGAIPNTAPYQGVNILTRSDIQKEGKVAAGIVHSNSAMAFTFQNDGTDYLDIAIAGEDSISGTFSLYAVYLNT